MGQVQPAAAVEPIQQLAVERIARPMPEAHEIQRRRDAKLEARRVRDPAREFLRQLHMAPDVVPQALDAVMADHEP